MEISISSSILPIVLQPDQGYPGSSGGMREGRGLSLSPHSPWQKAAAECKHFIFLHHIRQEQCIPLHQRFSHRMECNDCLFEGWNEQTCTTHLERWPGKSEVETYIIRADHINDKPEGDKMLGDPKCTASGYSSMASEFAGPVSAAAHQLPSSYRCSPCASLPVVWKRACQGRPRCIMMLAGTRLWLRSQFPLHHIA